MLMEYNGPLNRFYHHLQKSRNPPSTKPKFEADDDVQRENETVFSMDDIDSDMNSLVLKNLTKFYGDFCAVQGISVGIKNFEIFGLLGINGV